MKYKENDLLILVSLCFLLLYCNFQIQRTTCSPLAYRCSRYDGWYNPIYKQRSYMSSIVGGKLIKLLSYAHFEIKKNPNNTKIKLLNSKIVFSIPVSRIPNMGNFKFDGA